MVNQVKQAIARWAYRALVQSPSRPLPNPSIVTVDEALSGGKRKLSWALTRDLEQNFIVVGWAVNQHLSYTSSFSFQARTPDMAFNSYLEEYCYERFGKNKIDIAGRMSLDTICRAFMASKIWDGDAAIIKTNRGMLQLLEAWQIANMPGSPSNVTGNGLVLDKHGRAVKYAVCVKDKSGSRFESLVDAENMVFDGYFIKANQTRGVSPLMPVINSARDVMDAESYYLLKAKIAAMFGIVIYRDHGKKGAYDFGYENTSTEETKPKLDYEIRPGLKLELEKDEKAQFLESNTPPMEFLNFATFLLRQILCSLNIPYTMYDSSSGNYSASRSDLNRYKNATSDERAKMLAVYDDITDFILRYDILSGALKLPRGMTYESVNWEWIPTASFVIDIPAEVDSRIKLLEKGLTTRANISKELGTGNFFRNADALAAEEKYLKEKGVTVSVASPGAPTTTQKDESDLTSQQDKKE